MYLLKSRSKSVEVDLGSAKGAEKFDKVPKLVLNKTFPVPEGYPRQNLDEAQVNMLEELKKCIPEMLIEETPENKAQREKEIKWLDEACLLRYLRATKWDLKSAGMSPKKQCVVPTYC